MLGLVWLLALQAPQAAGEAVVSGKGAPTVDIPRIEAHAVIDGVLDEPVWQQAARLGDFSQYEPVDSRPAEERTVVLVWYAPDAIYFGIQAFDSQPGTVRATRADRDNIDNDDHVTIYLDTFNDRRRAFFFSVNPLGVQQDGVRTEGASSATHMFGGNVDNSPDFIFQSRGHVTNDGYVVEVRIPFKSLRYPGGGTQKWGLNIERKVQRTGYTDTWTDVRRASASFLLQAGTIEGLHDLHRGVVVEAQPFVTATANGARETADAPFRRESINPDAGLNLRFGFTNLAVDATVNPDFSQVESDQGQVTINERFALFFPEKRPFFLEGIDLFSTPNQLIYTRQIVNPIAGGKITGKFGNLGLAHLTAVDQGVDGGHDALFNVTRLRQDFGSNSTAGLTYTDRSELQSSAFNRVLAGDARIVFAKLYYVEGQLGGSWTRDDAGRRSAGIWKAEFDRTGRSWGFNYQLNGIGDDFDARAGFVPRVGVVTAHGFNRISFYGARGSLFEQFTTFFGPTLVWNYGDFGRRGALEGTGNAHSTLQIRGGWQVSAVVAHSVTHFDPAAYAGYETTTASGGRLPYQPLDRVSGDSVGVSLQTPTFRVLSASVGAGRGRTAIFAEGSAGTATSMSASVSLRPTESIRIFFTNSVRVIDRAVDGTRFARAIIPRLKVEFQPSRPLFFRAVGEYRSERQSQLLDARTGNLLWTAGSPSTVESNNGLRVDLLASFEPSPGTVAFFGYGSSLATDRTFGISDLQRLTDGFFIKLAYQFRH